MEISMNKTDERITVLFNGRLDTVSAISFDKQLPELDNYISKEIVFDCSELTYVSSSGLRIFIAVQKKVSAAGGKLMLKNMSKEIQNVFVMTGMLRFFTLINE